MTFDALLSLGMILEAMAVSGKSLEDLVAELPIKKMRKGEVPCPPDLVYKALEGFRLRFVERVPDCTDGVLVNWPDAWMHVRASNTEPLLRVIVESETAERADQIFEESITFARRLVFGHVEG
jgi:phosphomannomutase